VRAYVVERPVEEQVQLREERVIIERRPAADAGTTSAEGPQERDIEIVERHEEPVVAKQARAEEEIVVHKEATDRIETVRDKVRETKVDVDQGTGAARDQPVLDRAAAGSKPAVAPGPSTASDATAGSKPGLGQRVAEEARDVKEDAKDALSPNRRT
jgi:hypothetical protein